MRRAIILLLLITGCFRPSQSKTFGYVTGGALVSSGGGLVALAVQSKCGPRDGYYNSCEAGNAVVGMLGASVVGFGIVWLGVQLLGRAPKSAPAPAPAPPAPPPLAATADVGLLGPDPANGRKPALDVRRLVAALLRVAEHDAEARP